MGQGERVGDSVVDVVVVVGGGVVFYDKGVDLRDVLSDERRQNLV